MQLSRSIPNLVNHQYGICRMYSEENPGQRIFLVGKLSFKRIA